MRKIRIVIPAVALFFINALAAAETVKIEEILPESTLGAVILPDMSQARDAAAKTRLASMYAQPEMQEFLKPVHDELKKQYDDLHMKNPMLPAWNDIDASLLSGGMGLGLYARPGDQKAPFGIAIVLTPKDAGAFLRIFPEPIRQALNGENPMPLGQQPSDPAIAFSGGAFILGAPQGDMPKLIARANDPAARAKSLAGVAHFKKTREKLADSKAVMYLAPKPALDFVLNDLITAADAHTADVQNVIKALGLANLEAVGIGIGVRGDQPVMESYLSASAPLKEGIFALLNSTGSVDAEGLKIAAADAPFVAASSINLAGILPLIQKCLRAVDNPAVQAAAVNLTMLPNMLAGFDVQNEFLANLGSDIVVAQTAIDTGAPLSFGAGMIYSIPVKDPGKIEAALQKLGGGANAMPMMQIKVKHLQHKGKTIYYIGGQVLKGPAALCVAGKRLLVGNTPNAVRRSLDQLEKNTDITANKDFQETIARLSGKPFDARALPPSFSYSVDESSGTGSLMMVGAGVGLGTMALAGIAEIPDPNAPREANAPMFGGPMGDVMQWLSRPSGKVAVAMANAVDLGLWPDEGFFVQYRHPTGQISLFDENGLYSRTELPIPMPRTPINGQALLLGVAGTSIVAAIAIPSLLRSRMAANETAAAASCKAFAEAEEIYHRTDYNKDGVLEYSQHLKGDWSLLENKADAADLGLIDKTFGNAEGNPGEATPKAGYVFKVLTEQGEHASGGKRNYIVNGRMTLGYALVAAPAKYDSTGRNTFIVNNVGTIFQKDLGPTTEQEFRAMKAFDPAPGWTPTE